MTNVVKIKQTCSACPSQWEGLTDDDRQVYVRFRWGHLSISVGEPGDKEQFAGVNGKDIYSEQLSDSLDGVLSYEQLKSRTKAIIEWPESDNDESEGQPLEAAS